MLIFRDVRRPRPMPVRTPRWLEGLPSVSRRESENSDLVTAEDPMFLAEPPAGALACQLPEDWIVYQVGDFVPTAYLLKRPGLPRIAPVTDSQGRAWHAPVILQRETDAHVLSPPWGTDANGQWIRKPTPAQEALITAARAARAELLSGKIDEVPVSVAASWAITLLAAVYALPGEIFPAWGLFDDKLVLQVLITAAGLRPLESRT